MSEDCEIGRNALLYATSSGNLAMVEYGIENDFPFDESIYTYAIHHISDPIPIIKLLRNSGYPWNQSACAQAAANEDLKLLRWLRFNGCSWDERVCNEAVKTDNLKILRYAHKNGCTWTKNTYAYCFADGGLDDMVEEIPTLYQCSVGIIRYLHKHNCPQPDSQDWILPDWIYRDY